MKNASPVSGAPLLLLRLEGSALLAVGIAVFAGTAQSWWLAGLLFLAPDLSFLGYLAGPRMGAMIYNALHTTLGPAIIGVTGWYSGSLPVVAVAAVWLAHVGMDRALGYGLKYPTAFQDTHLGRLGRRSEG